MVLAFIFMEITGNSYVTFTRRLTRQPEITTVLGFSRVPDESAFSRTWRDRFDDAVREYVQTAAHFVVKEVNDFDIVAPEVRPKAEIVEDNQVAGDSPEDESFSENEIVRTTRLAREHGFSYFESGRAANVTYEDSRFFELQTFMGMVGCGTAQELPGSSIDAGRSTARTVIHTSAPSSNSRPTNSWMASTTPRSGYCQ